MGTSHDLTNQAVFITSPVGWYSIYDWPKTGGSTMIIHGISGSSTRTFWMEDILFSHQSRSGGLLTAGRPRTVDNKNWLKQTLKDGFIWFYHTQPDKRWNMLLIYRWCFNHAHVQHEKWMITDRFLYEKMGFNMFKPPTSKSLFMNMPIFVILRIQITSEEKFTPWNMRWNHQHTFQHYILKCLVNGL